MSAVTAPSETRLTLAAKVRMLRKSRHWSQEDLAEKSGLHRNYIGGIERGERNIGLDSVDRLARALGVPAAELVSR